MSLYDFFEQTRCDRAQTFEDLDRAGKRFADGVAAVGVGGIMFILSFLGARGKTPTGRPIAKPNAALVEEVVAAGGKINPSKVVQIEKLPDGRIVWLEEGSPAVGLKHILLKSSQYAQKGISEEKIPALIFKALREGKIVGQQGKAKIINGRVVGPRQIYEVEFEGKIVQIAIDVSSNGFIVGANPRPGVK